MGMRAYRLVAGQQRHPSSKDGLRRMSFAGVPFEGSKTVETDTDLTPWLGMFLVEVDDVPAVTSARAAAPAAPSASSVVNDEHDDDGDDDEDEPESASEEPSHAKGGVAAAARRRGRPPGSKNRPKKISL